MCRISVQAGGGDFAEMFAALDGIGYHGTITFESFSSVATSARRFVLAQRAAATA